VPNGKSGESKTISQAFYLDVNSKPILIWPTYKYVMDIDTKLDKNLIDVQEDVIEQIKVKYLKSHDSKVIMREKDMIFYEDEDFKNYVLRGSALASASKGKGQGQINFAPHDQYISCKNTIIKANALENCIYVWTMNEFQLAQSLKQYRKEIKQKHELKVQKKIENKKKSIIGQSGGQLAFDQQGNQTNGKHDMFISDSSLAFEEQH